MAAPDQLVNSQSCSYLPFTSGPMSQTDGNNPVTFRDKCNIFVGSPDLGIAAATVN